VALFCYTVALRAVTIAETLLFRLCSGHHSEESRLGAMNHSVEFLKQVLSATRRYATYCSVKFKPKIFLSTLRYAV
jgi:hypothetical protein